MGKLKKNRSGLLIFAIFTIIGLFAFWQLAEFATAQVLGTDILYTTDSDFDQGTLLSVNHDAPNNDQLQLDQQTKPFPFINVAASGRGTVVRTDTETGEIVGEYRTAPEGRGLNPSRTTVDLFGNVWTANRDEADSIDGIAHGSAVKIGLIVGGSRVNENGESDPAGGYLAPPFGYNTCADRDGDGLIRTSNGLGDVLDWPDITDGMGGADGMVEDAVDECILIYQRLSDAENARHVSVDADNNVWVGGYPFQYRMFYKLDGSSGAILDSFDAREIGCGGYGGLIDGNGILWSVGGPLLRYDPTNRTGICIQQYGYGLGIDTNGYIWLSLWDGGIVKIAPDGTVMPGYPKPTYLPMAMPPAPEPGLIPAISAPALAPMVAAETQVWHEPTRMILAATQEGMEANEVTPSLRVSPVDDWVQSFGPPWTPGATISLTIEDGGAVVYSDSQTADGDGNFNFNLWGIFDVQRGQVVTVSDGITTKTHTVTNLYVDGIDVDGDDVFGRADPGTEVHVWVHGNGDVFTTTDGDGNWRADFSGQTDLTYLSDGGAQQIDSDSDSTTVWWASPQYWVAPVDEWVQSRRPWTPGATITLTIEDGGAVVYSDSQTADANGNFNFNLWDVFDLQRGQVVTVSDGTNTKTHTVANLYVDGVDIDGDDVYGRAEPEAAVHIWVHGNGDLFTTADGSGSWRADFSGQTDLTYMNDGGSEQVDSDGDSTGVWWASPQFQVAPVDDWVQSIRPWIPGATITLTIEDGGVVVFSDSQTTDANGNFNFNLWDLFDLQRGQVVIVSDGTTTKTHTVANLYVDGVDVDGEAVYGRADPGTDVHVWVHGDGDVFTTADGSGSWLADFSGQTDLTFFNDGGSQQTDEDGDSTGVWWASPQFQVAPVDDWIGSKRSWMPDAIITLTIEDGGVVVYSDSQTADPYGNFNFNLWDVFDVQRGQVVTVSDGMTTKTHTVMELYVDGVDLDNEVVFGRGEPGRELQVWVDWNGNVFTTPDGDGNWLADFSSQTDLNYLSQGGVEQYDDDGDSTGVWWTSPRFQVNPLNDVVQSRTAWAPLATILLTIEEGGFVVYSDWQTADGNGNFHFDLWGRLDLQPGQVVTVSDGTTTKSHIITNLYVSGVDVAGDDVFGTAEPGTQVDVHVGGDGMLTATADGDGNWLTDFTGMTDISYLSDGNAEQLDSDGDGTRIRWAGPRFQVAPDDEWVGSSDWWTPGATVSLTIEDGGVVVYSDSQTVDANGSFNFNLWDVFDLQRGQVVTVSDGTTTKTHTVWNLYVDGFDITSETVYGRAQAGTDVEVWVHGDGNLIVTADGSGNWVADFSGQTNLTYVSDGGSQQSDEDGDSTGVWWASPRFQAAPDENWVQSSTRWTPGALIMLTIEEGGVVVYSGSVTADSHGNFYTDIWGVDMAPGQVVTVSDGLTTKTHTITDLMVTSIDTVNEQILGTANAGAQVEVRVSLFDQGASRWVTTDAGGNWVADFSVPADGQPAYDISGLTQVFGYENDEDGDQTYRRFGPPQQRNRGVAVTPVDNHVWVASSGSGTVTRLDNDGNVLKVIETGTEPTGVAIDAAGKVWATNLGSDNAVRIDPSAGPDGLGAVDLTVDLGPGASPYNYSDMTGAVVVGSTSLQGFWAIIQDSLTPGFEWGRITWNSEPQGSVPPGTEIVVEARSAESESGLGGQTFQPVVNGELFSMFGRFIEVRVTLKTSVAGVSPVLSDIRIQAHVINVGIDIKPGSFPNTISCLNRKETITVAVLTTDSFNAMSVDHTTVTFEGAREMHVDRKTGLPLRHIEDVDLDGDLDLVFHFMRRDTALTCSSVAGTLTGMTYDGIPIEGTDSVRMVK